MSAPDRVSVDHPGATAAHLRRGRGGKGVDDREALSSSSTSVATGTWGGDGTRINPTAGAAPSSSSAGAADDEHATYDYTSAWTIGATDGAFVSAHAASDYHFSRPSQMSVSDHHPGIDGCSPPRPSMSRDEHPEGTRRRLSLTGSSAMAPPAAAAVNATSSTLSALSNALPPGSGHPTPALNNLHPTTITTNTIQSSKSLYQDRLFNQPSTSVEAVLAASCEALNFDIAEMWLRTGPKTHQLINSHLRPTALEDSVRIELVDVYYGERSSERTHRLSPALCKRAKEAMDVVWVTANTPHGAEALKCSISDVRTAVAIPVCHPASNTNITLIFFSIRRCIMTSPAVEFLVHMSLAAAVASVNSLGEDGFVDHLGQQRRETPSPGPYYASGHALSQSEHPYNHHFPYARRMPRVSATGAHLDLKWSQLKNVEYLTDGGNNWIHTAVYNDRPVVVKTLKPECQDLALAINEIEGELEIHSRLNHPNIVELVGAGMTSKGVRFVVLERLDGGSLTQMLGYDTRIRDRRRRFWKKKQFSFMEVLKCARSIADAMEYCHGRAIPGCMCLHRDLKPDNIGFTLNGEVKIMDFGLARIVENALPESDEVYHMSGETGSLRYMAPEVADARPYNHKADVYSFGIILWEINAYKKPFDGMNRETFYARVVHGGERPMINKKWPEELSNLMMACWSANIEERPTFSEILERLDALIIKEKGGLEKKKAKKGISALIDRHSTWF